MAWVTGGRPAQKRSDMNGPKNTSSGRRFQHLNALERPMAGGRDHRDKYNLLILLPLMAWARGGGRSRGEVTGRKKENLLVKKCVVR